MALLMSLQTCCIFIFRLAFHLIQLSHSRPFREVKGKVIWWAAFILAKKVSNLDDLKNAHVKTDNLTSHLATSTVPNHLWPIKSTVYVYCEHMVLLVSTADCIKRWVGLPVSKRSTKNLQFCQLASRKLVAKRQKKKTWAQARSIVNVSSSLCGLIKTLSTYTMTQELPSQCVMQHTMLRSHLHYAVQRRNAMRMLSWHCHSCIGSNHSVARLAHRAGQWGSEVALMTT